MPTLLRLPLLAAAVLFALAPTVQAQAPEAACVDGTAAGFACENVDLLAFITSQSLGAPPAGACPQPYPQLCANDVWGWEDAENGRRYAIVGLPNGTAFVDVTVPTAPVRLGLLPTATDPSSWRDVKALGHYALVVSEAAGHGMQIFDMRHLRGLAEDAARRFTADARYTGITTGHNVVVDEATGFAYAVGARAAAGFPAACDARGLHAIDLSDPLAPAFAGCITDVGFSRNGYTHDAQCLVYDGPDADHTGKELCFAANEDIVSIFDVTDKAAPVLISQVQYPMPVYTHQGWLTEDRRYFLANDELDERNGVTPTQRTLVLNVEDLDDPEFAFAYDSGQTTIDHNLYVLGGLAYQSNYQAGFRLIDLAAIDAGVLSEVASFDTYSPDTAIGFAGQWSNYPFFGGGLVIANDAETGLFLLQVSPTLVVASADGPEVPAGYALTQPHPNPTSGTAELTLAVDAAQAVRAELFDIAGRRVASVFEGPLRPGTDLTLAVQGADLPAGVYLVRVTGETFTAARRVVLTR